MWPQAMPQAMQQAMQQHRPLAMSQAMTQPPLQFGQGQVAQPSKQPLMPRDPNIQPSTRKDQQYFLNNTTRSDIVKELSETLMSAAKKSQKRLTKK